jgi:hypothetical protein
MRNFSPNIIHVILNRGYGLSSYQIIIIIIIFAKYNPNIIITSGVVISMMKKQESFRKNIEAENYFVFSIV